jgi:hypothetical protein
LINKHFNGEITSYCFLKEKKSINSFFTPTTEIINLTFDKEKCESQGVLLSNKREYFVTFKKKKEISRKRTFEGIRLMIGFLFFNILFSILFLFKVGPENVGKTTIKDRLIGAIDEKKNKEALNKAQTEKEEYMMTHGVDIYRFKSEKDNFMFSLWDFA